MLLNSNDYLNFVAVTKMYTPTECDYLIKLLDGNYLKGKKFINSEEVQRVVDISLNELPKLALDNILKKVFDANSAFYKFNLTGFHDEDPPLMFKYEGAKVAKYDWHNDFGPKVASTRKLSFSVLLSDPSEFVGGQLEFLPSYGEGTVTKGDIIVFPSFLTHRVSPVTNGVRYCIVGWVHGEAFQ